MAYLTSVLKSLRSLQDCDFIDQLNNYYTTFMLIVFAILVSAKQYVGYPIQCWVPAHFTEAMEQYTENYCWIQNTWWMPLSDHVPNTYDSRDTNQLKYYQWVPFILLLEAIMFHWPTIIWQKLCWKSEVDLHNIVKISRDARIVDKGNSNQLISSLADHIESIIEMRRIKRDNVELSKVVCIHKHLCNKTNGYRLSLFYLCIKFLYICNVLGQFFMLAFFLGSKQKNFGFELFVDLISGRQWQTSGVFPRVTLCDFEVKVMGNVHRHTVQCVLMINMFNEKIFLFLWFWFAFLLIATTFSFFNWSIFILIPKIRYSFVKAKLRLSPEHVSVNELPITLFSKYLGPDVIFTLKMISSTAGDNVVSKLLHKLFSNYNRKKFRNRTLSVYSNSISISSSKQEISLSNHIGNILLDVEPKEVVSFKEVLYHPLYGLQSKNDTINAENAYDSKDKETQGKRYSAVSMKGRHLNKQRSWIGGKKLTVNDRRRLDKTALKFGTDDEDDSEEESI